MPGRSSLPRTLSLKGRAEISNLFESGRRISTDRFTLIWEPAERFGYAVFLSRRHGSAVERNRIKRRFREAIRLSRRQLEFSCRCAFVPRQRRMEPPFEQLVTDVSGVFERVNRQITSRFNPES